MKKENSQIRLNFIMSERNLRQVDILRLSESWQRKLNIKLTKHHISNYVNGVSNPDQKKIYLLAKTLDVSEPWLMGYDVPMNKQETEFENHIAKTVRKLRAKRQEKVLHYASDQLDRQRSEEYFEKHAIDWCKIDDYKKERKTVTLDFYEDASSAGTAYYLDGTNKSTVTLPLFTVPNNADFVVTVSGDSMEPEYYNKDYVFVQQTFNVFEGDIGIFIVDGKSYIKQLKDGNENICLHNLNKKYEDIIVDYKTQHFRVVGKVVGRYAEAR